MVMRDAHSVDDVDAFEPCWNDASTGTGWHPISQAPMTTEKFSSMPVSIGELDCWEEDWLETHRGCLEAREEEYQALVESGPANHTEELAEPLECCGTPRPCGKVVKFVVRATSDFITVHDYLSAVHPWLLSLRDDILSALGVDDDKSLPADTKLMVFYDMPTWVSVVMDRIAEEISQPARKRAA